jgi:CxxC motif-containing protein
MMPVEKQEITHGKRIIQSLIKADSGGSDLF